MSGRNLFMIRNHNPARQSSLQGMVDTCHHSEIMSDKQAEGFCWSHGGRKGQKRGIVMLEGQEWLPRSTQAYQKKQTRATRSSQQGHRMMITPGMAGCCAASFPLRGSRRAGEVLSRWLQCCP